MKSTMSMRTLLLLSLILASPLTTAKVLIACGPSEGVTYRLPEVGESSATGLERESLSEGRISLVFQESTGKFYLSLKDAVMELREELDLLDETTPEVFLVRKSAENFLFLAPASSAMNSALEHYLFHVGASGKEGVVLWGTHRVNPNFFPKSSLMRASCVVHSTAELNGRH